MSDESLQRLKQKFEDLAALVKEGAAMVTDLAEKLAQRQADCRKRARYAVPAPDRMLHTLCLFWTFSQQSGNRKRDGGNDDASLEKDA